MNLIITLGIFVFFALVIHYPKIGVKNKTDENQIAIEKIRFKDHDVQQAYSTLSGDGVCNEEIELFGFKFIENREAIAVNEEQKQTALSKRSPLKTTSTSLNYEYCKTSLISLSFLNKEKGRNATCAKCLKLSKENYTLTNKQTEKQKILDHNHYTPSNEAVEEENVTHSIETTHSRGFLLDQPEDKVPYDEQYSPVEREVLNFTLQLDLDDNFDWRRLYNLTRPEQYPYSVLIVAIQGGNFQEACTGTIISKEWVLTAAHCFPNFSRMDPTYWVEVYAGGNSLQEWNDYKIGKSYLPETAQLLMSTSINIHPFYTTPGDYDVALIKVVGEFIITPAVNVVRLASASWNETFHGYTSCVFTGFGTVQVGEQSEFDLHRKTTFLDIKSPCLCFNSLEKQFGKSSVRKYLSSKPRHDYGVCQGDSGGGLVCDGMVRGVASFFLKFANLDSCEEPKDEKNFTGACGDINTLNIFLDTCAYILWINDYTNLFHPREISKKCAHMGSQKKSLGSKNSTSTYLLWYLIFIIGLINTF